jgi:hypothetical protein
MRKRIDMNIEEKAIAMSYIENNDNDIVKELGTNRTSHYPWRKEFKDHEFEYYFRPRNPNIKDFEYENICLQKMINDAKKEQALLKEAINVLFV